jgi:hypothetical protein
VAGARGGPGPSRLGRHLSPVQYGYIPTHIGRNAFWDGLSDSGGYAHLLSAGAEWLLYLDGKNDWEVHRAAAAK